MQLHLVFPGLLWPQKALHDTAFDLELPALARLLGRASKRWQPQLSLEAWLCREFGILAEEPPVAALRLLGEGGQPGRDYWLCADPAHLGVSQSRLSLKSLAIDPGTMQQISASLSPHFRDPSAQYVAGSHHYLRLATLPAIITTPPSAVIGRAIPSEHLRGPEARAWLRLGNEMQMLLHALPANREREDLALPAINTLWFWGAGSLPQRSPSPYQAIFGDHALLQGLAAWGGIPYQENFPELAGLPRNGMNLLLINDLQGPAQELDAEAWRQALEKIERDILQPVQALLRSGRIKSLRISALGEEACLDIHLERSDLFKFWRRPLPVSRLSPP